MDHVYSNELRHLMPDIRLGMIASRRKYRDQQKPVQFEDEVIQRARLSGISVSRSLGLTPGPVRGSGVIHTVIED